MRNAKLFLLLGPTISLVACGSVAQGVAGDAGPDAHLLDGASHIEPGVDGGSSPGHPRDGGSVTSDDGSSPGHGRDGGAAPGVDGGSAHHDGGGSPPSLYVDAGLYHGDGSFFVDGGAYRDAGTSGHGGIDAEIIDAAPGCAPLAACCSTLSSASQGLCNEVVASGNSSDCATELTQLQNGGDCTGVSILASQVQVAPNRIVSDGTTLFWTTTATPGLAAMPVGGGAVTVLLDAPITNEVEAEGNYSGLLAVDSVNVYLLNNNSLIRIPKDGSGATLVNDSAVPVLVATTLGSVAYWVESESYGPPNPLVSVKTASLQGGPVSVLGQLNYPGPGPYYIGATSSTVFVGGWGMSPVDFPTTSGVPAGGPPTLMGAQAQTCFLLTSDTSAVYCGPQYSGSNIRIASDGTISTVGPVIYSSTITPSPIVFDDTYAYWVDNATAGTIMKAPKAGGGTATIVAHDTNPTAIAVDANSVYWADQGGYIKSIAK